MFYHEIGKNFGYTQEMFKIVLWWCLPEALLKLISFARKKKYNLTTFTNLFHIFFFFLAFIIYNFFLHLFKLQSLNSLYSFVWKYIKWYIKSRWTSNFKEKSFSWNIKRAVQVWHKHIMGRRVFCMLTFTDKGKGGQNHLNALSAILVFKRSEECILVFQILSIFYLFFIRVVWLLATLLKKCGGVCYLLKRDGIYKKANYGM